MAFAICNALRFRIVNYYQFFGVGVGLFGNLFVNLLEKHTDMARKSNTGIPGLSFSWKRALGITQAKQQFARKTGIPTSKAGVERKLGATLLKLLLGR